jgi:hypothetical protein
MFKPENEAQKNDFPLKKAKNSPQPGDSSVKDGFKK